MSAILVRVLFEGEFDALVKIIVEKLVKDMVSVSVIEMLDVVVSCALVDSKTKRLNTKQLKVIYLTPKIIFFNFC